MTTTTEATPTPLPGHTNPAQPTVDIFDIDPHDRNVRLDLGDLTELTASVKEVGILQPLVLAPRDGRYVIIAGHRRHAAALAAGLERVPATIRTDLVDDVAVTLAMLAENLHRSDLTAIEEATAYQQLELAGLKPTEIANRSGRARATVTARLSLMKLPEPIRAKVHNHQLTLEHATKMARFAGDPATMKRLAAVPAGNLNWALEEEARLHTRRQQVAKVLKQLKAAGVTVVDKEPVWGNDLEYLDLDPTEHATCPHNVAYIKSWKTEPNFYCVDPTVHPETAASTAEDATRAAKMAAQTAEREAHEEAVAIAAALRATHIRSILTGQRALIGPVREELLQFVATNVLLNQLHTLDGAALRELAGLTLKKSASATALREAAEAAFTGRPILGLFLAMASHFEISYPGNWTYQHGPLRPGAPARAWLDLLVMSGYELSQWEIDRLADIDAAASGEASKIAELEAEDDVS